MNIGIILMALGGLFAVLGLIFIIKGIKNIRSDNDYSEINQGYNPNYNNQGMNSNPGQMSMQRQTSNSNPNQRMQGNMPKQNNNPNMGFSQVYGQPPKNTMQNQGKNQNNFNNVFDNSDDSWGTSDNDWSDDSNDFSSDDSGFSDLSFDDVFSDSPRKSQMGSQKEPPRRTPVKESSLDFDDVFGNGGNQRRMSDMSDDIDLDEDLEEF